MPKQVRAKKIDDRDIEIILAGFRFAMALNRDSEKAIYKHATQQIKRLFTLPAKPKKGKKI